MTVDVVYEKRCDRNRDIETDGGIVDIICEIKQPSIRSVPFYIIDGKECVYFKDIDIAAQSISKLFHGIDETLLYRFALEQMSNTLRHKFNIL